MIDKPRLFETPYNCVSCGRPKSRTEDDLCEQCKEEAKGGITYIDSKLCGLDWGLFERLTRAFPRGIISCEGEFIAHKSGEWFNLRNCETELDVKCKVIEYFSRAAFKTEPYRSKAKNDEFHEFMLNGINKFLGTYFIESDMEDIYTYLGNAIRHDKTVEFITKANYNMSFFDQFKHR